MRRIVIAAGTTATGLALLLNYPTSQNRSVDGAAASGAPAGTTAGATTAEAPAASGAGDGTTGDPTTAASPTTAAAPTSAGASGTFDGSSVQTRFGPVQVRIEVKDGQIVSADAIDYPTGNPRDQQINSYAIPILNDAVVQAQSAKISMISGATYTSDGYIRSLQSALDQANL